jgi:L-cysteate sulfo-lyase
VTSIIAERLIAGLPCISLGAWPTPLERLPNLSAELGIDLWIKRDDVTTLALGGNKVRKLEFLMGHATSVGCDCIVTTGGSQSNHARLTAAACARLGLPCHLVLDRGRHPENGNLLLDNLFGASVRLIEDSDPAAAVIAMNEVADGLRQMGANPFVIPRGGSIPQGSVGYAQMVTELERQLESARFTPDVVYVATGSCGTHSGIMAGRALAEASWRVQGVSVSRPGMVQEARVIELSNQTLEWIGSTARVSKFDVSVDDSFTGPAYGVPTSEMWTAVKRLASREGIVLDPVYTGKAFAGLMHHVTQNRLHHGAKVVFVHTGGSPALFAYADEAPFDGPK